MGCADFLIEHYGFRRFLADLDRDRNYLREAAQPGSGASGGDTGGTAASQLPSVVACVLDWVMNEGFQPYFERFDWSWESSHEFRQRHFTGMMLAFIKSR